MKIRENEILIVTPVYNEELNINFVIADIKKHCSKIDWLVINDASTDNTLQIIKEEQINYLNNEQNNGSHKAVQKGITYAYEKKYKYVITFDSDRQHKAEEIKKLIKKMEDSNCDVVIGSRYLLENKQENKMKRLVFILSSQFIKIMFNKKLTDTTSGFKCMNRKVMKEIVEEKDIKSLELSFLVGLLKKGYKICEIDVEMRNRIYGESMFEGFFKKVKYMNTVITETIKKAKG